MPQRHRHGQRHDRRRLRHGRGLHRAVRRTVRQDDLPAADQVVAAANLRTEPETAKRQAEATAAMSATIVMSLITLLAPSAAWPSMTVMTTRKSINDIAGATDKLSKGDNTHRPGEDDARRRAGRHRHGSLKVFRDNQLHLEQLARRAGEVTPPSRPTNAAPRKPPPRPPPRKPRPSSATWPRAWRSWPGDLTFRVTADFPGDYRKLKDDFNGAMGSLQETMKVIAASTDGLRTGADEIAHASDDLSRRTEQQAASLEETAAALDELTATVRRTASGAAAPRTSSRRPVAKPTHRARSCIRPCRPWAPSRTRPSRSARSSA
jgi:methyl-accepting chemotaxis protein